jgi:glycosyltransferase involved in cell wall biosynthesis
VIPAFNAVEYLAETLESVLAQDGVPLEIIVVDDGSTDGTAEVAARFAERGVRCMRLDPSGGPSRPRNRGIDATRGRYVALFDSDDLMLPGKLRVAVDFMEQQPGLGLVFTDFVKFREGSGDAPRPFLKDYDRFRACPRRPAGERRYVIGRRDAYATLFYENYIGTSGVVIPREVLQRVGPFDESLKNADDRDMWFRIAREYDIGFIDMVGHRYRVRETSVSFRGASLFENRVRVYRKQQALGLPPMLERQARRLIAGCWFNIGYRAHVNGDRVGARAHYRRSLGESYSGRAAAAWLKSWLPQTIYPRSGGRH